MAARVMASLQITTASRGRSMTARGIALAAAVFLFAAQLAGVAHIHRADNSLKGSVSAAAIIDDGLCALCLFHFHSPTSSSPVPSIAPPRDAAELAPVTIASAVFPLFASRLYGRAPPASL
jgi:hypothetical protein